MIKKEPFNRLETGWMSPDGDFYPAEYMEHIDVADKIWSEMYKTSAPLNVDQKLVEYGWVSIHCMTCLEHGFLFNFHKHLTVEQRAAIKPIFEENINRIIKSSRHELEDEFEN